MYLSSGRGLVRCLLFLYAGIRPFARNICSALIASSLEWDRIYRWLYFAEFYMKLWDKPYHDTATTAI